MDKWKYLKTEETLIDMDEETGELKNSIHFVARNVNTKQQNGNLNIQNLTIAQGAETETDTITSGKVGMNS